MMAMCLVLNNWNGTVTGLKSAFLLTSSGLGDSDRATMAAARSTRPARSVWRFISEALPHLDGDVLGAAAALDGDRHLLSRPELAEVAVNVLALPDGSAVELGDAVAGLQPGHPRRPLRQHALHGHALGAVGHLDPQKAARGDVGVGLGPQEAAQELHDLAHRVEAAGHELAVEPLGRGRLVVEVGPGHLALAEVELDAVAGQQLVTDHAVQL